MLEITNLGKKVLVLGDVMLDQYWFGDTHKISPEAPVPVVRVKEDEYRLGGAGNVAMNIASLGIKVSLQGIVGKDDKAEHLAKILKKHNILDACVRVENKSTITKLRVLSQHQQILRLDFEDDLAKVDKSDFIVEMKKQIQDAGALVLSDYGKGTLSDIQKMIQISRECNIPVFVDPKGVDFTRYKGATCLTPNMSEFEAVVGKCTSEAEIIAKGKKLIAELGLEALLLTRSEQGMTLIRLNEEPYNLNAQAKEVYDVTGAGDTVIAVLAGFIACGKTLEEACFLANIAAGIVVGKLGTSTVSIAELNQAFVSQSQMQLEGNFGVIDEATLLEILPKFRSLGTKIVMTNGCFDILHSGHISYLEQAKQLGDLLIVAVNSDASVQALKGETRPINDLQHRMSILAGLKAVDWVVDFNEETPKRLISQILPDVLVKGGDYQVSEVVGASEVLANGGEVKIMDFKEGFSTTKMINIIKERESK